jgi:hypothetical protein
MTANVATWRRAALLVPVLGCCAASVHGQTPRTVWDTPEELMDWVAYPNGLEPGQTVPLETGAEDDRDFVRLMMGRSYPVVFVATPGGNWPERFHISGLKDLPAVMQPQAYNAIRIVLRHGGTGLSLLSGVWAHRSYEYDDVPINMPTFGNHESPDDGIWHEVVLRLTESPLLEVDEDVVHVHLGLISTEWRSLDEGMTAWTDFPDDSYLDIDRIELLMIDEAIPAPTISDFHPKRGTYGTEVTIEGSGFGEPAQRNMVLFGETPLQVLSGTSSSLVVRMVGGGTRLLTVVTPGGQKATAAEPYVRIGHPRRFEIQAGGGQHAPAGTALEPFVVRLLDARGQAVPGEKVAFRVTSGDGTLSASEVLSGDDGLASAVLTLGPTPGTVTVKATLDGFRPRVFTAVATQP